MGKIKLMLFFLFISLVIHGQEKGKIVFSELAQHWILSQNESSGDTLVFHPEGHEAVADAPMHLRYGGWTFFPEGQVSKHRWKKCGNDPEPDFRSGSWKKKGNILKIKVGRKHYLFEIVELNKDLLKVRDLSEKK